MRTVKQPKKILIVEDNESLRYVLCGAFTRAGFTVLNAKTGRAGLSRALKDSPTLILLDILMPDMDGVEMAKKMKELKICKNTPIMFLSNSRPENHTHEIQKLDANVCGYIDKTQISIKDLVKMVQMRLTIQG